MAAPMMKPTSLHPLPHRGAQLSDIGILPVRDVAMSNHHHAAICRSAGRYVNTGDGQETPDRGVMAELSLGWSRASPKSVDHGVESRSW